MAGRSATLLQGPGVHGSRQASGRRFLPRRIAAACAAMLLPLALHAAANDASPIFGVRIPDGYRQWVLVAVSHETGSFNELRGILGNPVAVKAYSEGSLPFPDGSVLVKLAWKREPSAEFPGAFVPGHATTVQVMVKDSARYASTGDWGFGRFIDGAAADHAQHETCFGCHRANVKDHDYVYTRWAP
jgi:hypothetical protein